MRGVGVPARASLHDYGIWGAVETREAPGTGTVN